MSRKKGATTNQKHLLKTGVRFAKTAQRYSKLSKRNIKFKDYYEKKTYLIFPLAMILFLILIVYLGIRFG